MVIYIILIILTIGIIFLSLWLGGIFNSKKSSPTKPIAPRPIAPRPITPRPIAPKPGNVDIRRNKKSVDVYGRTNCGLTNHTKKFLASKNIKYNSVDIDKNFPLICNLQGQINLPVVVINGNKCYPNATQYLEQIYSDIIA